MDSLDQLLSSADAPRTLRDADNVAARRELLQASHIAPLSTYVAQLRGQYPGWEFPDFDPLDGGVMADLLFLLEKPGPMTSPQHKRKGSGFISRDNDDPTAEAVYHFMRKARIERTRTVLWNTIPGWNGQRAIGAGEVRAGIEELLHLLNLLPHVTTVVLVGNKARRAEAVLRQRNLRIFRSAHPGPLVKGPNPTLWNRIPHQWAEAAAAP
ncbi:uracil-DNA glycosylase [Pseudoduganella sp. R-34]|uniref:uracil-DNA glycosylase n=1 Tax=Pseudoduganella sp. R-34 TaxID=3404062 RepID=UPI003CFB0B8B